MKKVKINMFVNKCIILSGKMTFDKEIEATANDYNDGYLKK